MKNATNMSYTPDYLHKRKLLPPFIGPLTLGGFIIGTVISGDFVGWQTGLLFGWANMVAAVTLVTVLYLILVLSISEMCTALPFTAGPSVFAQAAFNSEMCAFSGGLYAVSYTFLSAIMLVGLGNLMDNILQNVSIVFGSIPPTIYWLPISAVTLLVHCRPRILFRVMIILTIYSLLLLVSYLVITVVILPPRMRDGYAVGEGRASLDFSGLSITGIIRSFPFASWMYIGVASFPSASEEARKIMKTAPTVALYCYFILTFFSVSLIATVPNQPYWNRNLHSPAVNPLCPIRTSILTSNSTFNASYRPLDQLFNPYPHFIRSKYLLLDNALNLICSRLTPEPGWCQHDLYNTGSHKQSVKHPLIPILIALTLLPPGFLSFLGMTYVSSRQIYFLSRSGILPIPISRTHSGAPMYATGVSLTMTVLVVLIIDALNRLSRYIQPSPDPLCDINASTHTPSYTDSISLYPSMTYLRDTSLIIIHVCVFVSCLMNIVHFGTYIALRIRLPYLPRPFVSPLGTKGAYVGLVLVMGFSVVGPLCIWPIFYGTLLAFMVVLTGIGILYWIYVAKNRVSNCSEKHFIRHQLQQLWGRAHAPIPLGKPSLEQNVLQPSHPTIQCSTTVTLNSEEEMTDSPRTMDYQNPNDDLEIMVTAKHQNM